MITATTIDGGATTALDRGNETEIDQEGMMTAVGVMTAETESTTTAWTLEAAAGRTAT
jgi:hypothetical protein